MKTNLNIFKTIYDVPFFSEYKIESNGKLFAYGWY